MIKRKKTSPHEDDTQPIDYERLAKEVVKEQERQKASEQGCGCLLLIVVVACVWVYFNRSEIPILSSLLEGAPPPVAATQTQRIIPTRTIVPRAKAAVPTKRPTTAPAKAPSYLFHVCADRIVNMRMGAGFSNYATAGEMRPGRSYPVVAQAEGESVQGNTTWYQIADGGRSAFVTSYYTYACNAAEATPEPARDPAEQATIDYITSCKDRNLLTMAQTSKAFPHNEIRRATAFCASKQLVIDMKVNGFLDTLDETKREMYALICALRTNGYGITFDVDSNFYDFAGNQMESRAVLARFGADVIRRINCDSYHGAINWDYAAEEWWVHRALRD